MGPKAKTITVVAVAAVVAALVAWFWRGALDREKRIHEARKSSSATPSTARSGSTPLAAAPATSKANGLPAEAPSPGAAARAMLLEQYDWKAALAQLDALASLTPAERLFYRALILDACSVYAEMLPRLDPALVAAIKDGKLEEWIAKSSAAAKSPAEKAAKAFGARRNIANVCRNFAGDTISREQVMKAWQDAAAAGDLKAQARLLQIRRYESGAENARNLPPEMTRMVGERSGPPSPMSAADQALAIDALLSGDPIAIRIAGDTFSLGTDRQSFRFGPDQVDLGEHQREIWDLVACQFGFECGARNLYVSTTCAERGWCADDYLAYLRDSALSPGDFQFVQQQALAIADAIRRGDRSAFQLVDRRGTGMTFTGSPPPPVGIR